MIEIFYDMVKEFIDVFIDDFSVYDDSLDKYFQNLDQVLAQYEDKFSTELGEMPIFCEGRSSPWV